MIHVDTLITAFAGWLRESGKAASTVVAYAQPARDWLTWLEQHSAPAQLKSITRADIEGYIARLTSLEREPATINRHLLGVSTFCQWAVETKRLPANPAAGIDPLPQSAAAPRWLDQSEQKKLRRAMEQMQRQAQKGDRAAQVNAARDVAIVQVMLGTGLRVNEMVRLQISDLDASLKHVRVGARSIPLDTDTRQALADWLAVSPAAQDGPLFVDLRGRHTLTTRRVHGIVEGVAGRANLEGVSANTLRHTCARNMIEAGVRIDRAAAILGLSNLNAMKPYLLADR